MRQIVINLFILYFVLTISHQNPTEISSNIGKFDFTRNDKIYMRIAISLASKAYGRTRPNPCVGCVIVDNNNTIVGRGYHKLAGTHHAEVHALIEAGDKANGSTAYVTLEPCNHFGRTPPCTQALIK